MTVKEMKAILNTMDEDKEIYIPFFEGHSTNFSVKELEYTVFVEEVPENER